VSFILENGDRETYCTIYNHNPHYAFEGFDVYLNPETRQRNVICNPTLSGFNVIALRDINAYPQYYYMLTVWTGDAENEEITPDIPGTEEENVYLLQFAGIDQNTTAQHLDGYLSVIRQTMGSH